MIQKPPINEHFITNTQNFQVGRNGHTPIVAFIHKQDGNGDLYPWFQTNTRRVSAHFQIMKSGRINQFVRLSDTANATYLYNQDGISVEHEGFANDAVTEEQYKSSIWLYGWLCQEYKLPAVFLNTAELEKHDHKGISIHRVAPQNSTSCPSNVDYMRIINGANNLLNQPIMDDQIAHDGSNLVGHKLSDGQVTFETTNLHTTFNNSYGAWYETFRNNPECLAFNVNDLHLQITALTNANNEFKAKMLEMAKTIEDQAKTISDQLEIIKGKDVIIAELNRAIDMKNEEIMNLQSQLTTCLAGNLVPDIKINFFNLFQILIVKNRKK